MHSLVLLASLSDSSGVISVGFISVILGVRAFAFRHFCLVLLVTVTSKVPPSPMSELSPTAKQRHTYIAGHSRDCRHLPSHVAKEPS